ncbi:hypothetical protein G6L28_16610 [Agrobacterium larrymoorei]|uniref:hypothetical protein n=1 Tax=Agrobacterium larrymoorei TaxID=160699 RepID=UPI001572FB38|nr:hypothetical protein [Agrobacterium larrymoorei]NTJ44223.1 hypothetical protein [Agrobacterium larrymoorei]
MSKVVILGIEGEEGLWLADIEAGTLTRVVEPLSDDLAKADALRARGVSTIKGVDFAVAITSAAGVAASLHEG